MQNTKTDCIKSCLGLAVEIIDDFTGKRAEDENIRVWIENEAPCIRKNKEYYVFVNLGQDSVVLRIEGKIYRSREIKINAKEYREKVLQVRLLRKQFYSHSLSMLPVEARGEALEGIYISSESSKNPYRLIRSCEKGDKEIFIYHPGNEEIEGASLLIKDRVRQNAELFEVERSAGEGKMAYLLKVPLAGSYKKTEAFIYRVFTEKTGEV